MEGNGIILILVLFVFILTLLLKSRNKPEGPNISQTKGEVVHVYKTDDRNVVIAEFFVGERPYRAYDSNYFRTMEVGEFVEVYYDNRDPRESQLGNPL